MEKIIAIVNHKGGVAKTTTASSMASILQNEGKRVLIVDLDAQCNLTDTFLTERPVKTIYESFMDPSINCVCQIKENLDILPASINLSAIDAILGARMEKEMILSDILEPIKDDYDIIILDCPPALSVITVNALVAATDVLIPIMPEYYALKGLIQITDIINRVRKRLNRNLKLSGLIVTRFNATKNMHVSVDSKIREHYKELVMTTRIRENIKLAECPMYQRNIVDYAPTSNGAIDYKELTKEIIKKLEL